MPGPHTCRLADLKAEVLRPIRIHTLFTLFQAFRKVYGQTVPAESVTAHRNAPELWDRHIIVQSYTQMRRILLHLSSYVFMIRCGNYMKYENKNHGKRIFYLQARVQREIILLMFHEMSYKYRIIFTYLYILGARLSRKIWTQMKYKKIFLYIFCAEINLKYNGGVSLVFPVYKQIIKWCEISQSRVLLYTLPWVDSLGRRRNYLNKTTL